MSRWRAELLTPLAGEEVLEIGAGTGRNLELYPPQLTRLVLAEPDRHMRAQLDRRAAQSATVSIVDASAELLPYPDESFDAIVSTLVLCSVHDLDRALSEAWRVLRPGGRLIFVEHVAAPARSCQRAAQHLVEPVWRCIAGNCHLTRDTADAISRAGFDIVMLTSQSMAKAPFFVRPTIRGIALRGRAELG